MNRNKIKSCLLILIFSTGYISAQEGVPAAGGDASGSNGTLNYSIGQVFYTANSGSNGSVNEGVQQPYDISTNSIAEESNDMKLTAFPNPTNDVLSLNFEQTEFSGYSYELYNNQGQMVKMDDIHSNHVEIPMESFNAATYILKVKSTGAVVKSFRIVKH